MPDDDGSYVYAVVDASPAAALTGLHGIGGRPVRLVEAAGLAAVVSTVPLTEFGSEPLQRHLEDLRWLETTAREHHAVVQAMTARGPVAPLRLATVYLGDERVRELLEQRREELVAALDRVRGRAEWGVKVFAGRLDEEQPTDGGPPTDRPGTAYLLRRRGARERAAQRRAALVERAEAVHAAFEELALASHRYRPQDPALTGSSDEMLLNAAYLVDPDAESALAELARAQSRDGVRVELTGPWAPYSFSELATP
jgi:Gas vesicle synthesis protein GvpL/GvpF